MPYYQDVYDHVLRATEWTESLRDLVTTILETNLTIQGNRMNVITKKVTSWAAIIAVPTFITGFYGMNVPYPGFGTQWGSPSRCLMIIAGLRALHRLPPQGLAVSHSGSGSHHHCGSYSSAVFSENASAHDDAPATAGRINGECGPPGRFARTDAVPDGCARVARRRPR